MFEKEIDKNLSIPLHSQVREIILSNIESNRFKPGDMLPTELEMIDHFEVSRSTIRQAIMDLVKEGYLTRVKGRGTFVVERKLNLRFLYKHMSFNEHMLQQGMNPSIKVLASNIIEADEALASNLCMEPGDKAIQLVRLMHADHVPIAIVESYLAYDLCAFIFEHNLEKRSLHEVLSLNPDTKIYRVTRLVEAVAADKYESMLLNIRPNFPIQSFLNIAYNTQNRPIDYCISKYRGDRSRFSVEIFV